MKIFSKRANPQSGRVFTSFRFLLVLVVLAALLPIAYTGWSELYRNFLEHGAPLITETGQFPRGIGVAPATMRWRLSDTGAGLDEVVIRTRQKGSTQQILRKKLERRTEAEVEVTFLGAESNLEEGHVDIEIRVFDASFWSNATEKIYTLMVDFKKPDLRVVSTQHNAAQGGSQLVLYEAFDANLAVSGVQVGRHTFVGFSAKGLDKEFAEQKNLYACIYAIGGEENPSKLTPRIFAEDAVGNAKSTGFYNKISPQQWATLRTAVPERFLRDQVPLLFTNNLDALNGAARERGEQITLKAALGSNERLFEQFRLVNEDLRRLSNNHMEALLKSRGSFEKLWGDGFVHPGGAPRSEYGHHLRFLYEGQELGSAFQQGFEFAPTTPDKSVFAAGSGIVVLAESFGVYGKVLAIDHGLGVFSVYGHLDSASVSKGDTVEAGQVIAAAGSTGFALAPGLHFEMWVQGVPVSPREWWEKKWYYGHFIEKITAAKKNLGMAVYEPFADTDKR